MSEKSCKDKQIPTFVLPVTNFCKDLSDFTSGQVIPKKAFLQIRGISQDDEEFPATGYPVLAEWPYVVEVGLGLRGGKTYPIRMYRFAKEKEAIDFIDRLSDSYMANSKNGIAIQQRQST